MLKVGITLDGQRLAFSPLIHSRSTGSSRTLRTRYQAPETGRASRALQKLAVRRESQALLAVGVRAADQLESLGRSLESSVAVPSSIGGVTAAVEEVLRKIEEWHFKHSESDPG